MDLCIGINLTYFIKKQCPLVCRLELALSSFHGTGKRALLIAKKLTFQQRLRKGCTARDNKWLVVTLALAMDSSGDDFLARTALSGYQHRSAGWGHRFYKLKYLYHPWAFGNNALKTVSVLNLAAQGDVLFNQIMMLN